MVGATLLLLYSKIVHRAGSGCSEDGKGNGARGEEKRFLRLLLASWKMFFVLAVKEG